MGTPLRVLMIEDSEDDAVLLLRELRRGGYDVEFERVDLPGTLKSALDTKVWDLVVSDFSMPHFSGTDALHLLRAKGSDIPFIFVSGTMGEETAVAALQNGAQDYLMKTNLKRLVPAVQRALQEAEDRRQRKQMEQQVQQLRKFEAIGKLAGGIVHDFNNVIGVVLGWAEMGCEEAPPESRLHHHFQKIRDQAFWAARLTSQLLAFARRQVLQQRKLNLNTLVVEGMSLLHRVIGEQIEIRVLAAPDLNITLVDPTQIEQVLMNLCLNARDAMPEGGRLVIETEMVELDDSYCRFYPYVTAGRYAVISVSDTGIGMDTETRERIFEPFFTTKERGKGTGMGLATAYGIITQHGGFIHVYSEPSQGTLFRVYLPTQDGVAAEGSSAKAPAPAIAEIRGSETILIAEDHESIREMARQILLNLGYRVLSACDGVEALKLCEKEAPALAILDVVMPKLGGTAVASKLTALFEGLPILFTSGYSQESEYIAPATANACYLQKPYSPTTLGRVVREILDRT